MRETMARVREMARQRFTWWIWTAFALAIASYFLQFTDSSLLRQVVSLAALLCMAVGLTLTVRWGRRRGYF